LLNAKCSGFNIAKLMRYILNDKNYFVLLLNIFYFIYIDSWPTHIVESSLENKDTSSSYINKSNFTYPRRASWQYLPILAGFLAPVLTTGVICSYANESAQNQNN